MIPRFGDSFARVDVRGPGPHMLEELPERICWYFGFNGEHRTLPEASAGRRKKRPRFFEVTLPFRRSPKLVNSRKTVTFLP